MAAEPTTSTVLDLFALKRLLNHARIRIGGATLRWSMTPESAIGGDDTLVVSEVSFADGWSLNMRYGAPYLETPAHKAIGYLRIYRNGIIDPGDSFEKLFRRTRPKLLLPIPGYTGTLSLTLALQRIQQIAAIGTGLGNREVRDGR